MGLCWQPVTLEGYRAEAEAFASALDREYYLHFSGRRSSYDIEPIYDRHAALFSREAVEGLREAGSRELLRFAAEGHLDQATKAERAEIARREASLELELDGERLPFRAAAVVQANEPDPERRGRLEAARLELVERELNPLLLEVLERSRALVSELGWPSLRVMCEELSGIDLGALGRQTAALLDATEPTYEGTVEPQLRQELGFGFERLRRCDLPAFFRAPGLDELFPNERLLEALDRTRRGLGLEEGSPGRVILDVEQRPLKSPRAFCAPVRVPEEVYLVIPRIGGRDDYEALMHEAGHAEHYANVRPELNFEARYLGDNSVTEGFAFLFEELAADDAWLRDVAGIADPAPVLAHARASKLVFLRRYAAKLTYELGLHGDDGVPGARETYARELGAALHVEWPAASWLTDLDSYFYAACYLRAWALETVLRGALRERYGPRWFAEREAGALLRSLWGEGQAQLAEELALDLAGAPLELSATLDELALAA
jgi:hypothetical protein